MMGTGTGKAGQAAVEQPHLLHDILAKWASERGENIVLEFDREKLTYHELDGAANRLAGALQKRGIQPGDLVALAMGNRPEIAVAYFALARIGAVAVAINIHLRGDGLAHIFNLTRPRLAIIEAAFIPRLQAALGGDGSIEQYLVVGGDEALPGNQEPFDQLVAEGQSLSKVEVKPSDTWAIMFTSGTTGPSKGVMLSHNMVATECRIVQGFTLVNEKSISYTFLPLFHLNAYIFCLGMAVISGGRGVIRERFPQDKFLEDVRGCGATHLCVPPYVPLSLLAQPEKPDDAENPLEQLFTFGLTEQQWTTFEKRFGLTIRSAYGPSESGLICQLGPEGRHKIGSSGFPIEEYFEVRIVDEFDNPLPSGEVGEIICRPLYPYTISHGYYNNPEATAKAWRNLWFHTGDAGYLDGDGYLYFADRLKDMIKRRGMSIASFDVEFVLSSYPGIKEVAVVPYREPGSGEEEVRAFILAREEPRIDPVELLNYCSSRMAYYMVPRYLDFVQELPRNAIGKIEKFKLRAAPLESETFDRKAAGIILER